MTREQIDEVLERVRSWSAEDQERAVRMLLVLEENRGVYVLSQEERADIEAAEAEADRGEFATDEEMKALFDEFRRR
jgi:predicted transcriptional regulator